MKLLWVLFLVSISVTGRFRLFLVFFTSSIFTLALIVILFFIFSSSIVDMRVDKKYHLEGIDLHDNYISSNYSSLKIFFTKTDKDVPCVNSFSLFGFTIDRMDIFGLGRESYSYPFSANYMLIIYRRLFELSLFDKASQIEIDINFAIALVRIYDEYYKKELLPRSLDAAITLDGFTEMIREDERFSDTYTDVVSKKSPKVLKEMDDNSAVVDSTSRGIIYVSLNSFTENTADLFISRVEEEIALNNGDKYLIIDLRNNYGGIARSAAIIADYMIPEGNEGEIVNAINQYHINPDGSHGNYRLNTSCKKNVNIFNKNNCIVLTDKNTASASEVLVSCLKKYGIATIIGEKTYGKKLILTVVELQNDMMLYYASDVLNYANKEDFGGGIAPDILTEPGGDILLCAATFLLGSDLKNKKEE